MASRWTAALAALVFCALGYGTITGCSGLKTAEPAPDGGDGDGAVGPGDDAGVDGDVPGFDAGPEDAGPPPDDFACGSDAWTKPTKTRPECAARQVVVVEGAPALLVTGVSIGRTPAGRIGITYNSEGVDEGELHLAHFVPATPTSPGPVIVKRQALPFFHDGFMSRVVGTAPDTLELLTYDVSDIDSIGSLQLARLVNGKEPLTSPEVVLQAVPRPSEIGFAIDGSGRAYATARVATDSTKAKLVARAKSPGETWSPLPDVATTLLPKEAPGIGATSLFADASGQLHLLFHFNEVMQHSTPRYHTLAGTTWSYRKTVDNAVFDGIAGFSPRIATFGTRKYAVYFFRKALQSPPATADLRLATWVAETDEPQISIIDQKIPSDELQSPAYRVAMAVDKFGLMHLAIVRPSLNPNTGYLEYRRQKRIAGGATEWLSDIVDPDVLSGSTPAFVDLLVDDRARPHIAYRSAVDSKIRYATRYDR